MLTIQKFGGSSLADAQKLRAAACDAAQKLRDGGQLVIVVSARGSTTDALIAEAGEIDSNASARELDALLSTGEQSSAALMAMQLSAMGIASVSLTGQQAGIKTDLSHGDARITGIDTCRIMRELGDGKTVVVAGFQGINSREDITTLGRGGSDTTAVELAAALGADKCEICSDVDGIYTADPRLVTGARRLERIDYRDMLLLARAGSQVLHSRSVEAAMKNGVEVELRSSFVKRAGTVLTRLENRPEVCGVTRDASRGSVSIVGAGVDARLLADIAAQLAHSGIVILDTALEPGVCTLTVSPEQLLSALELSHALLFR